MEVREKLVELLTDNLPRCGNLPSWDNPLQLSCDEQVERIADHLIMNGVTVQEPVRPLEEWWEAYGDVLWWKFPIEEPPYVGSPLDENWPGYHTHWTPIPLPEPPKGE